MQRDFIRGLRAGVLAGLFALTVALPGVGLAQSYSGNYIFANDGNYFTAYGPSQYWNWDEGTGYCGGYASCQPYNTRWTTNAEGSTVNYARWTPGVQQDAYSVQAWIPCTRGTTRNAKYYVGYGGASLRQVLVDQYSYCDAGATLGDYTGLRYVELVDDTDEPSESKNIAFDEILATY